MFILDVISHSDNSTQTKKAIMITQFKIQELIGRDLKNFKIVEMTEVYKVDDGMKHTSFGFFEDSNFAKEFVGIRTDSSWYRLTQVYVLTDRTIGYVITEQGSINLFNNEAELIEIKKKVIARLSPAEREFFGPE